MSYFSRMFGCGVFIVAEIGKNFIQTPAEESVAEYLARAKALVDAAAAAGVDAVKFQTHELEDEQAPLADVVTPHFTETDRYSWVARNTRATPLAGRYLFFHADESRRGPQIKSIKCAVLESRFRRYLGLCSA